MEVMEAIRGRRSIRRYKPEPLPPGVIEELLECGNVAPYGNIHPWECIVVREPAMLSKMRSVSPGLFGSPPVVLVLCVDLEKAFKETGQVGRDFCSIADPSFAAQNIMLAAYGRGLGSCPIISFPREAVRILLGIPRHLEPIYLISLGYPAEAPKMPPRPALVERVFVDRYGVRLFSAEGGETGGR